MKNRMFKKAALLTALGCFSAATVSASQDTELILEEAEIETESRIDFRQLQETNEDVYSWIEIPGTVIDYPVLQNEEDEEYYLHRNIYRQEDVYGAIFSQAYNTKDYTDFLTVLYGHNMRDYTMFGSLSLYQDPNVMWDNKYVYIYLPEITLKYEIFAAYPIDAVHLLYKFDQDDEEDRREYLDGIAEKGKETASFDEELFSTMDTDSHILVLHTCYQGDPDYRFLVQAVLDEEEYDWDELAEELGIKEPEPETETETETESESETETLSETETETGSNYK